MDRSFEAQVADLEKAGAKVRILTTGELAQWQATTRYQEAQAAWVKQQEGRGIRGVGSVLEKVRSIRTEGMK